MTQTPNLSFTLVTPGQSQKEITVNEALIKIDGLLNNNMIAHDVNDPPQNPDYGDLYHIGTSPTEAWSGGGGQMALYTEAGWRFFTPKNGLLLWSGGVLKVFNNGAWQAI